MKALKIFINTLVVFSILMCCTHITSAAYGFSYEPSILLPLLFVICFACVLIFSFMSFMAFTIPVYLLSSAVFAFYMRLEILNGFRFIYNLWCTAFKAYTGIGYMHLETSGTEKDCITFFLLAACLVLAPVYSFFCIKSKLFMPVTMISLCIFVQPFIVGKEPAFFPLVLLIAILSSVIAMHSSDSSLAGSGITVSSNHSIFFTVVLFWAASLFIALTVFPETAFEKINTPAIKANIRSKITNLTKGDWQQDFKDFLNIETGTSSDSTLISGMNSGKLNTTPNVTFTDSTSLIVTLPEINEPLYLKSYSGVHYTKDGWGTLTSEDATALNNMFAVSGMSYSDLYTLPNALSVILYRAGEHYSGMPSINNYHIDNIQITYGKTFSDYLYLPYFTMANLYENFRYNNDLYIKPQGSVSSASVIYSCLSVAELRKFYDSHPYFPEELFRYSSITEQKNINNYIASEKAYRDYVYDTYLEVPDSLTKLADFMDGFDDDLTVNELISRLQDYFRENIVYSLEPGYTPKDKDFVEYFLFENKKGYCSYYATAGVLMLRLKGIPARYTEGYVVFSSNVAEGTPNGTIRRAYYDGLNYQYTDVPAYTCEIKDYNAHAWVEVYYDGIGWLPVEFTLSDNASTATGNTPTAAVHPTSVPTATPSATPVVTSAPNGTNTPTSIPESGITQTPDVSDNPFASDVSPEVLPSTDVVSPEPADGNSGQSGEISGADAGHRLNINKSLIITAVLVLIPVVVIITIMSYGVTRRQILSYAGLLPYMFRYFMKRLKNHNAQLSNIEQVISLYTEALSLVEIVTELPAPNTSEAAFKNYLTKYAAELDVSTLLRLRKLAYKAYFSCNEISDEERSESFEAYKKVYASARINASKIQQHKLYFTATSMLKKNCF